MGQAHLGICDIGLFGEVSLVLRLLYAACYKRYQYDKNKKKDWEMLIEFISLW